MKFYYIYYDNDDGCQTNYFTNKRKAKARINHLNKNMDIYGIQFLSWTIFDIDVEPTKKGILRALNRAGNQ
jgi:hypothetical protein|tara:strand:- start:89 stop:301 length:213 start_codon:yes stop_codon:yes gene_type:complete